MDRKFMQHVESLRPSFKKLMAMKPMKVCDLPSDMPTHGIYLFSEGAFHNYTGRSNRMRKRLMEHCRKKSGHGAAPFAFLLAREEMGMTKASYKKEQGREWLEKHPPFGEAFTCAKDRVSKMDVRFVEETDPLRQALLEMYVAITLPTKYNSFDNH